MRFLKKITTEEFITRARNKHGPRYDYSKTDYKGPRNKICVICKIHGEFYQDPFKHLKGNGCRKCNVDRQKLSLSEFISRSNIIHSGKYDYSAIKSIKNSKEKVLIKCPVHGEFQQPAGAHSMGIGCKKCGSEKLSKDRALSKEEFVRRACEVHKDLYDYSRVGYKNSVTKVCIICKDHGEFYQRPSLHLRSGGCPQCHHSIGERLIISWFRKRGIEYNHHYSFPDLIGLGGGPLEFDFYTKYIKFLVEYDGEQHFRPVRFNGISEEKAKEHFRITQHHDFLKNQYCINNNIPLLRVSYKEFPYLSEILTEKFLGIGSYFSKTQKIKYFVNEMAHQNKIDRDVFSLIKVEEDFKKIVGMDE